MVTENYQVGESSDDAGHIQFMGNPYDDDDDDYDICNLLANGGQLGSYRFTDVDVPQGATISSATLSLYGVAPGDGNQKDVDIFGVDEDDVATFEDTNNEPQDLTLTTAFTNLDLSLFAFVIPQWFTVTVTAIVQEIVDRGSWSAENAMAFTTRNGNGSRDDTITIDNYDKDTDFAAKLEIIYVSEAVRRVNVTHSA